MPRILCLFDYNCTTGFGTVSKNIVKHLKKKYGNTLLLDIVAINYFGERYTEYEGTVNVFSASKLEVGTDRQDVYGRYGFLMLLANNDYDGVFIIQDPGAVLTGMMQDYKDILLDKKKKNKKQPKSILYFPVDGTMFKEDFHKDFDIFDQLVVYTEFGRSEIRRLYPHLLKKLISIPHGVDSSIFHPITVREKNEYRKVLFGEKNAGKLIVMNLNRNQFRKDIPTTIWGFEHFKRFYNANSFLYLHMAPKDFMGWDLKRVLAQTSLTEGKDYDYAFPKEEYFHSQAPVEEVNVFYNCCDVYLTTTTGGGWELPVVEAMAVGTPVIAPLHSSIREISDNGKRLFGLENFYPYCSRYDNYKREQCDYIEVAETLNLVHSELMGLGDMLHNKVRAADDYVQKLSWNNVCKRWIELFDKWFF